MGENYYEPYVSHEQKWDYDFNQVNTTSANFTTLMSLITLAIIQRAEPPKFNNFSSWSEDIASLVGSRDFSNDCGIDSNHTISTEPNIFCRMSHCSLFKGDDKSVICGYQNPAVYFVMAQASMEMKSGLTGAVLGTYSMSDIYDAIIAKNDFVNTVNLFSLNSAFKKVFSSAGFLETRVSVLSIRLAGIIISLVDDVEIGSVIIQGSNDENDKTVGRINFRTVKGILRRKQLLYEIVKTTPRSYPPVFDSVDVFSRIEQRPITITVCKDSHNVGIIPMTTRFLCTEAPILNARSQIKVNITYWKADLSKWETESCECFSEKWIRKCTVWFFGTETTSENKDFIDTTYENCVKWCAGNNPPLGSFSSVGTTGLLKTNNIPNWPCVWTGSGTAETTNYFVIKSIVSIAHTDSTVMSANLGQRRCPHSLGKCETERKGWLTWKPIPDKFNCQYVKTVARPCVVSSTGCNSHNNLTILCPGDQTLHTITDSNYIRICDRDFALTTDQGLLISLYSDTQPGCFQYNATAYDTEKAAGSDKAAGFKLSSSPTKLEAEVNYLSKYLTSQSKEALSISMHQSCLNKKALIELGLNLKTVSGTWMAKQLTGIENVKGIIRGGFLYYYTCAKTNLFRILKNQTCPNLLNVEYSLEHTTEKGYLDQLSLEIFKVQPVTKCLQSEPAVLPWGVDKILIINSTGAFENLIHVRLLQDYSLKNALLFKEKPLYSVEELSGIEVFENQISKITQMISENKVEIEDAKGKYDDARMSEKNGIIKQGEKLGVGIHSFLSSISGGILSVIFEIITVVSAICFAIFVLFFLFELLKKGYHFLKNRRLEKYGLSNNQTKEKENEKKNQKEYKMKHLTHNIEKDAESMF